MKLTRTSSVALLAGSLVLPAVLASAPARAQPAAISPNTASSTTVTVAQDGFVNSYNPTANSTAYTFIRTNNDVGNNRVKRGYLTFQVSGVPAGVTGLTARMTATAQTTSSNAVEAHRANSATWSPATLTWNNQPGYAAAALSSVVPAAGQAASWDVTGALPGGGNGAVALALLEPAGASAGDIDFTGTGATPLPALTVSWSCGLDALLVPTCPGQALLGSAASSIAGQPAGDQSSHSVGQAMQYAQTRYGRTITSWHTYHPPGSLPLDSSSTTGQAEISQASSGNSVPVVNWKPAADWSTATGSNTTVNAQIKQAALNVKAVAPHKIMLSLFHEPENDVGGGAPAGCSINGGNPSGNTPANYLSMWANVENIFAQQGVSNAVWTMIYMDYSPWTCLRTAMWPGNSLVDWVGFDSYQSYNTTTSPVSGRTWNATIGGWYNWLNSNSTSAHNYSAHPYGLFEFGESDGYGQQGSYDDYADAKAALDNGTYPNLRAYVAFDEYPAGGPDYRVNETAGPTPVFDQTEQQDFNSFANDPLLFPTIVN